MRTVEGIVIEITEDLAKIKVGKHDECTDCGACPGKDSAIVTARNTIGASPGQRVCLELKEANELKGAFIVFVLPLAAIFVGIALGSFLGRLMGIGSIIGMVTGGLLFFLTVILFIKSLDKKIGNNKKALPLITGIIK